MQCVSGAIRERRKKIHQPRVISVAIMENPLRKVSDATGKYFVLGVISVAKKGKNLPRKVSAAISKSTEYDVPFGETSSFIHKNGVLQV